MRVKIIVDSSVDLAPELRQRATVVPLCVRFGDREYQDGVTITPEVFYKMLAQSQELPTTSQPTPAAFEDAYREAVEAGYEVLCITIASKLSGTYQSATIAAEEFPGKVFVLDSRTAAIASGVLAAYAIQLADQGMGAEEILHVLMEKRKQVRLYAMVDTLEYLKKGGRLNSAVAVVGGLLNIKPVITLNEAGEIQVAGTARGMKKAFSLLNQACAENGGIDDTMPAMLGYTGQSDENLHKYREESMEIWNPETPETVVCSVIGVHAGPGAVAAAFFCKE